MKRLIVTASETDKAFQFINDADKKVITDNAMNMLSSWSNAKNQDVIDEQYPDFNSWLQAYSETIAYDVIDEIKSNSEFETLYDSMDDNEHRELEDKTKALVESSFSLIESTADSDGLNVFKK